jgi:transposase
MGEQYVGIDLHRRRSVIVRMTPDGEVLETVRVDNDPVALSLELAKAGPDPEVVLEATYGWYWAADLLQACGAKVHLAHPLGVKMFGYQRARDRRPRLHQPRRAAAHAPAARGLAGPTPGAGAARAGALPGQAGGVAQRPEGPSPRRPGQGRVRVPMSDLFGVAGTRLLDQLHLGHAYALRVASLRTLVAVYDQEIAMLGREISTALAGDVGYLAIQTIPGVGPVLAAVFVAEIGDVHRFAAAPQLCSWAGLTPRHRESDTTVRRGPITKQGPRLVRWAAVEAVQRLPVASKQAADFHRIADRRGTGIGRVAAARRLLRLVYYGLRDGQVRCLASAPAEAA